MRTFIIVCACMCLLVSPIWGEESNPSDESCIGVDTRELPIPTNFLAVYNEPDVTLTWNVDTSMDFEGFRIYYGIDGAPQTNLALEVPYVSGQSFYNVPWSLTPPPDALTTFCFIVRTYNS